MPISTLPFAGILFSFEGSTELNQNPRTLFPINHQSPASGSGL
jgi:hypothetical protein